jgi:hypothetical protein
MVRSGAVLRGDHERAALLNEAGVAVDHLSPYCLRDALVWDCDESRRDSKGRSSRSEPRCHWACS